MQVVATKSFFGSGLHVKQGNTYDVKDKLAKAWLKAGIVREATDDDKKPATATTSKPATTAPAKATGGSDQGKEVVTDTKTTETKPPVAPASKPTGEPTGNGDTTVTKSTDDATTTTKVATNPTTSVKPDVANTNPNTTKESK